MHVDPSIFKDYDIRAVVDEQIDLEAVERIGHAIVKQFGPKTVAVGYDMRVSSPDWFKALAKGLTEQGADVIDLGMIATDMVYYAAGTLDVDFGVMISASHNPPKYNGMKMVKRGAVGVSGNSGIYNIRDIVAGDEVFEPVDNPGSITQHDILDDWIAHALKQIDASAVKPLKVVIDAGNGMAGKVVPAMQEHLPIEVVPMYFELDGTFPNHLANPLLEEAQTDIIAKIKEEGADLGVLFDGDGDRMFLVDEKGTFISGTITTAMVAEQMLKHSPSSTVLYNAICGRIVPETVEKHGGTSHRVRVGHTLIKEDMVKYGAIFAGEHSGHYYFKENFKADSGLIAVLTVLELMSEHGKPLSEITTTYDVYPSSGEINFEVPDKKAMMDIVAEKYSDGEVDWLDGVSFWFDDWWGNLRPSNTQPVLRLNVEADNQDILDQRVNELKQIVLDNGGTVASEH